MSNDFNEKLIKILKKDPRFVDEETGELIRSEIVTETLKIDKKLIELLLADKKIKAKFFTEIKKHWVFNINDFIAYIQDKNFLADSYTKFRNKVGLTIDGKYLNERKEVALVWPFKDCVLEGGMTKEDQKRNEVFFNEILAQDEIDRLLDPKVLTNFKRYTSKGKERVTDFKRAENGTIKENLIIKGNNLLALHSLKEQFQGKIKLIYIDPPYNTGADSFKYNDKFNHSAWLTFMKNRLENAKQLLSQDGAIFVQIDHHELGYLTVLMDELFGKENKIQVISVKVASPSGFKAVNPGPIDVTEYILFYTKNKSDFKFKRNYVPADYHPNYNLYMERPSNDVKTWRFIPIKKKVLEINGFKSEKEAKERYKDIYPSIIKSMVADFAFNNADKVVSIRDLHKPTEKVRKLQQESREDKGIIKVYKKANGTNMYLYKGGALAFYSSKIKKIDGQPQVIELLSDFWNHISWAGIAKEGQVRLKNGKKPEKLIKQIFEIVAEEGDVVLDYHLGCGTTCAVAHKMGLQYIGIEQLDYRDNDSIVRLRNVIGKANSKGKLKETIEEYDTSGISPNVFWKGGGDFICCELMKFNENAVKQIQKAKNSNELQKIWDEMCEKYFLNYDVDIQRFSKNMDEFKKLDINKQKKVLIEMLSKNQLYVNLSEIDDSQFKVGKEGKELNKKFYQL